MEENADKNKAESVSFFSLVRYLFKEKYNLVDIIGINQHLLVKLNCLLFKY